MQRVIESVWPAGSPMLSTYGVWCMSQGRRHSQRSAIKGATPQGGNNGGESNQHEPAVLRGQPKAPAKTTLA